MYEHSVIPHTSSSWWPHIVRRAATRSTTVVSTVLIGHFPQSTMKLEITDFHGTVTALHVIQACSQQRQHHEHANVVTSMTHENSDQESGSAPQEATTTSSSPRFTPPLLLAASASYIRVYCLDSGVLLSFTKVLMAPSLLTFLYFRSFLSPDFVSFVVLILFWLRYFKLPEGTAIHGFRPVYDHDWSHSGGTLHVPLYPPLFSQSARPEQSTSILAFGRKSLFVLQISPDGLGKCPTAWNSLINVICYGTISSMHPKSQHDTPPFSHSLTQAFMFNYNFR